MKNLPPADIHVVVSAPSSLVIRNAASKQTTLSLLGTSETGYQGVLWTTTALRLQWLVPLMHQDVCRSTVHGGSKLSLQALYDGWQTLCPWQWKCCFLLPLNDGPGTLSLPANFWLVVWIILLSPRRKTSEASRKFPWLRSLQYLDCILFLPSMLSKQ